MAESGGEYPQRKGDSIRSIMPHMRLQGAGERLHCIASSVKERMVFYCGEEEAFGARFLLLPIFLGIGIIIYFALPFEPDWSEILAAGCFAAGFAHLLRRQPVCQNLLKIIAVAAAGALCAKAETARLQTVMVQSNGFTFITARIMAIEPQPKGGWRIIASVMSTQNPEIKPQPQRLRLSLRRLPQGAKLGDGLRGLVFLRSFSSAAHPNGYNFAFQGYFSALGGQGKFMGEAALVKLPPAAVSERIALKLTSFRHRVTERIIAAVGGEKGAVAAALITGERAGIADSTKQALRIAGLAHILSISGLHMAMAAGMVLLICRWVFGLFPVFFSFYAPKKIAAFIALFAAGFYLLLSGADISAKRSFVMTAVMLIAVICDRTALSLRNLAVSACFMLLLWPHEIMSPSFQMSFAAAAALISAFGSWSFYCQKKREQAELLLKDRGLPKPHYKPLPQTRLYMRRWIIMPVLSTCAASLVAGLAGGIYSAYHFNNTAPYGILSNVLALPIMSVLVMPFALLGMILMPLHLEALPLQIMGLGIIGVEETAIWVASFSPQGNLGFIPPLSLLFLSGGMVILIILRTALRCCGLFFIIFGIGIYMLTPLPLAVIAENGRLIAVLNQDKSLSLNKSHISSFNVKNWQTAFAFDKIILPRETRGGMQPLSAEHTNCGTSQTGKSGKANMPAAENKASENEAFLCKGSFCCIRLRSGEILAVAEKAETPERILEAGNIIVLNYLLSADEAAALAARAQSLHKILILQRDLALRGSAEIVAPARFSRIMPTAESSETRILWAVRSLQRPWSIYRRFSERARDMPA